MGVLWQFARRDNLIYLRTEIEIPSAEFLTANDSSFLQPPQFGVWDMELFAQLFSGIECFIFSLLDCFTTCRAQHFGHDLFDDCPELVDAQKDDGVLIHTDTRFSCFEIMIQMNENLPTYQMNTEQIKVTWEVGSEELQMIIDSEPSRMRIQLR